MGTSKVPPFICLGSKDHPHACGDKRTAGKTTDFAKGSSPRVWGQVAFRGSRAIRYGIIPTRVGTSYVKTV